MSLTRIPPLALSILLLAACSRSPEERAAEFLRRGREHFDRKDPARAILEFRNAIQASPRNAEAYYQLGRALLAKQQTGMAVLSLRKAIELNPGHADAQIRLAELMSMSHKRETLLQAQTRAQAALQARPGDADALSVLAFSELRLGDLQAAESHARQAIAAAPRHLRSVIVLAQIRMASRDPGGAVAALVQATEHDPESAEPFFYLATLYAALNRHADAEEQLTRAVAIDPGYAPAVMALASVQENSGRQTEAEKHLQRLSSVSAREYGPAYAWFLFRSGRPEDAITEFQRLAADTNDREARTRLVQALVHANRRADAEQVLTDALRKNSGDVDALLQRSAFRLAERQYREAQSDLHQAVRARPDSGLAHFLLARVYRAQKLESNAIQELREALRLTPGLLPARLELADRLLAQREPAQVLDLLGRVPQAQQGLLSVAVRRNWALLALNRIDARKAVESLAAKYPGSMDVLLQRAIVSISDAKYDLAAQTARQILQRNANDTRALDVLVRSYRAQNQLPRGLQEAIREAARYPAAARLQHRLGEILESAGDRARARSAFEAASKADQSLAAARLGLARLDLSESNTRSARSRLAAIAEGSKREPEVRLLSAFVEEAEKNYAAALEHYRAVTELDPRNVVALNNMAYLTSEHLQRPVDALKYAEQAKAIEPDSSAINDTMGWIYYRMGVYGTAVKYLEPQTAGDASPLRLYHLAMAYAAAGRQQDAARTLERALRLDSRMPEAEMARRAVATPVRQP